MNREQLIQQVKERYQVLASMENRDHITRSTTEMHPEAYYEKILNLVIDEINKGTFDSFSSGKDIVEEVANNKGKYLYM
jgi:hypothetical protein